MAELLGVQVTVVSVLMHELFVRAFLNNLSLVYYDYPVRMADGGKPVRYDKLVLAGQKLFDCRLYLDFGFGVDGACSFIQNEKRRVC